MTITSHGSGTSAQALWAMAAAQQQRDQWCAVGAAAAVASATCTRSATQARCCHFRHQEHFLITYAPLLQQGYGMTTLVLLLPGQVNPRARMHMFTYATTVLRCSQVLGLGSEGSSAISWL